jgi:hypothetical protein
VFSSIPITGRLIEEEELDHDQGVERLQDKLCFTEAEARAEVKKRVVLISVTLN